MCRLVIPCPIERAPRKKFREGTFRKAGMALREGNVCTARRKRKAWSAEDLHGSLSVSGGFLWTGKGEGGVASKKEGLAV